MAKVKFDKLSKSDQIFRIVNLSIMGVVIAAIVGITIYYHIITDPRVWVGYIMLAIAVAPLLVELIFRTRLPNIVFLGAEIYLVLAGVWGALLYGYQRFDWLDIVIHTLMGYTFALVGLFVISRITDHKKMSVWAVALFCFVFSLGIELVWELCEWGLDNTIHTTMQGKPEDGFAAPLLTDTMFDLLCNFSGALLFTIQYLVGKLTKLKVGVNTIEKELTRQIKSAEKEQGQESDLK